MQNAAIFTLQVAFFWLLRCFVFPAGVWRLSLFHLLIFLRKLAGFLGNKNKKRILALTNPSIHSFIHRPVLPSAYLSIAPGVGVINKADIRDRPFHFWGGMGVGRGRSFRKKTKIICQHACAKKKIHTQDHCQKNPRTFMQRAALKKACYIE